MIIKGSIIYVQNKSTRSKIFYRTTNIQYRFRLSDFCLFSYILLVPELFFLLNIEFLLYLLAAKSIILVSFF